MILKIRTMSQRHRCRVEKGDDSMEAIEKMVQEALDSTKSAHKRIDRMEKRQDNLDGLTKAFRSCKTSRAYQNGCRGDQGRCEAAGL